MGGRGARSRLRAAEGVLYSIRAPNEVEPASLNETPALGAPEDVTEEYKKKAAPRTGSVSVEPDVNTKANKRELAVASWLYETFGGEITVKKDENKKGVLTPDYLWNGKLWDLKTTSTEKAANAAMRHGLAQIAPNPGGVILDYRGVSVDIKVMLSEIRSRIIHRGWSETVDVLVITDSGYTVFRYK